MSHGSDDGADTTGGDYGAITERATERTSLQRGTRPPGYAATAVVGYADAPVPTIGGFLLSISPKRWAEMSVSLTLSFLGMFFPYYNQNIAKFSDDRATGIVTGISSGTVNTLLSTQYLTDLLDRFRMRAIYEFFTDEETSAWQKTGGTILQVLRLAVITYFAVFSSAPGYFGGEAAEHDVDATWSDWMVNLMLVLNAIMMATSLSDTIESQIERRCLMTTEQKRIADALDKIKELRVMIINLNIQMPPEDGRELFALLERVSFAEEVSVEDTESVARLLYETLENHVGAPYILWRQRGAHIAGLTTAVGFWLASSPEIGALATEAAKGNWVAQFVTLGGKVPVDLKFNVGGVDIYPVATAMNICDPVFGYATAERGAGTIIDLLYTTSRGLYNLLSKRPTSGEATKWVAHASVITLSVLSAFSILYQFGKASADSQQAFAEFYNNLVGAFALLNTVKCNTSGAFFVAQEIQDAYRKYCERLAPPLLRDEKRAEHHGLITTLSGKDCRGTTSVTTMGGSDHLAITPSLD